MDEEGFGFSKGERLRKRADFLQVYSTGERLHTPLFVVYIVENKEDKHRLGITVSRRIGKSAIRNRIKRRFRELFRMNKPAPPPFCDLVVNVKKAAAWASWRDLEAAFLGSLERWRRGKREC